MDDVTRLEDEEGVPASIGFAAMIALGKGVCEAGLGLLGIAAANSMDDTFGGGVLVFGVLAAIGGWLLWRGSRAGYYITLVLSAIGLVVAVVYLFRAESGILGATTVLAIFNALVLYLLLGRKSTREYFAR
jgi:uncharacterized membrane protein (DUF2068 family)